MTSDPLVLELAAGGSEPVHVEWDVDALAALLGGGSDRRPFEVRGAFDAERWELARVISAALADGRLVALAALRPRGAGGHGEEAVGGVVVRDGETAPVDEALVSVEYGPDGEPRRIGLELYERPDSLPLRIAGDRSGRAETGDARFDLRAGEVAGWGSLATLRPR